MPFMDVYVSYWKDALDAGVQGKSVGTPVRRSPFIGTGRKAWECFHDWSETGQIDIVQTDWAGWVAKVDCELIVKFVDCVLKSERTLDMSYLANEHLELRSFIDTMDPLCEYALVATEL